MMAMNYETDNLHEIIFIGREQSTMCNFLVPWQAKKVDKKYQPISEGISREPWIISSHAAPQKIVTGISFRMTTNAFSGLPHFGSSFDIPST